MRQAELVYRLVVVHHRGVHDHDVLAEGAEADGLPGRRTFAISWSKAASFSFCSSSRAS
jgi:hypothetical protein